MTVAAVAASLSQPSSPRIYFRIVHGAAAIYVDLSASFRNRSSFPIAGISYGCSSAAGAQLERWRSVSCVQSVDEMSRSKAVAKTSSQARKRPNPKVSARTVPFLTGNNLNAVLCVLLAGVTIALYLPVIGHSFLILDDHDYVTANPHVHDGLSWSTFKWAFTSTAAANWHPLTWLSHALDYQLFALNPAGHHLDSMFIHALNAALLFLLLAWVTQRVGPSLLVAALFALHPINVESVAWVAERKNVLSTLFFLLAIGAYVRYAQKPDWRRYLLVAALFAAGLMAKPMVITLPFVLLLLDYWPLDRIRNGSTPAPTPKVAFARLVSEKVPLLVSVGGQRLDHPEGAAIRNGGAQSASVPARDSNRERARGLRALSLEDALAGAACALSAYRARSSRVAMDALCGSLDKHHCIGDYLSPPSILARRMVLVSGNLVPVIGLVQVGDASHGGPLCLRAIDRNFRDDCVGPFRLGGRQ